MKHFKITGTKYSTEPRFLDWDKQHNYPFYDEIDTMEFPVMECESVHTASNWLLDNYPEYYFGCSIVQVNPDGTNVERGDFLLLAIPSYYEMEFQTTDRDYILKQLRELR